MQQVGAGAASFRDYFKIVPPGTDLTYALLIKLFGVQMWILFYAIQGSDGSHRICRLPGCACQQPIGDIAQRPMEEEPASRRSRGRSIHGGELVLHSGSGFTNMALLFDRVSAPVLSFTDDQQLAGADRRISIPCRPHYMGDLFLVYATLRQTIWNRFEFI